MEINPKNTVFPHSSFTDFNQKYARIIEQGTTYAYQLQRLRNEDHMFKTQSQEKFENDIISEFNAEKGPLFVSGSTAPITLK